MAILVTTESGIHPAYRCHLGADEIIVGRDPQSGLFINESFVSRRHAVISFNNSTYSIRDLGSKNGTWVNDQKIGDTPKILQDGDSIQFGSPTFSLTFMEDDRTMTLSVTGPDLGLRIDIAGREVYIDGSMIYPRLQMKEFDILSLLWEKRGFACSRDEIIARGWPERTDGVASPQEIEQYISKIRKRIGDTDKQKNQIVTLQGYGYKLL